jgi:hypothetical protein
MSIRLVLFLVFMAEEAGLRKDRSTSNVWAYNLIVFTFNLRCPDLSPNSYHLRSAV